MTKKYFPFLLILTVACGKASNQYPELPLINSKTLSLAKSIPAKSTPFVLTAPVILKTSIKNSQNKLLEVQLLLNELDDLKDNYRSYMNKLFSDKKWNKFQELSQSIPFFQITDESFLRLKSQLTSINDLRTHAFDDSSQIYSSDLRKYCGYKISLFDSDLGEFLDIGFISEKNCREGFVEFRNLNNIFKNRISNPLFVLRNNISIDTKLIIFDGENSFYGDLNVSNIENSLKPFDENAIVINNQIERLFNLDSSDDSGKWEFSSSGNQSFVSYQYKKFRKSEENVSKEFDLAYEGQRFQLDLKTLFQIDLYEDFILTLNNFTYKKSKVKNQDPNFSVSNIRCRSVEYNPTSLDIAEFVKQGFYLNLNELGAIKSGQSIVYKYRDGIRTDEIEKVVLKIRINREQFYRSSVNMILEPNFPYTIYEQQKWIGYWEDQGEVISFADHVKFHLKIEQK